MSWAAARYDSAVAPSFPKATMYAAKRRKSIAYSEWKTGWHPKATAATRSNEIKKTRTVGGHGATHSDEDMSIRTINARFVAMLASSVYSFAPDAAHAQDFRENSPSSGQQASEPERDTASPDSRKPSHADDLRIGVLAGVGFPRPLAIEGLIDVHRRVALGAEYSFLPAMSISGVQTELWAVAADARVFPFRGSFFVGLRAGHQHAGGHASIDAGALGTVSESLTMDTTFLNPRIGFLWILEPGIALGIDAGVQIPMTTTTSDTLPKSVAENRDLVKAVDTLGHTALPTIDLLRVGFLL